MWNVHVVKCSLKFRYQQAWEFNAKWHLSYSLFSEQFSLVTIASYLIWPNVVEPAHICYCICGAHFILSCCNYWWTHTCVYSHKVNHIAVEHFQHLNALECKWDVDINDIISLLMIWDNFIVLLEILSSNLFRNFLNLCCDLDFFWLLIRPVFTKVTDSSDKIWTGQIFKRAK